MDKEIKITKGHKTLFVFDIIMPIISIISFVLALLGLFCFIYAFKYIIDLTNPDDALIGIFVFLLLVVIGCIPMYLYGLIFIILIALAILSIIFRNAFIKSKKIWLLIYIEASVILPIILAGLYFIITDIISMFS